MKYFNISEYDVIFLSYDEPNAENNYQQLLKKIPKAKRVHGIKGSDTAHKECAKISTTDRLIIVDGDNWVDGDLLNQSISLDDSIDHNLTVFSWPSINIINSLEYGNGGIKCWPRDLIFNIKSHENCDTLNPGLKIDFCWDLNYMAIDTVYSKIINNASKMQAWRSGFREGVKLSLNRGNKVQCFNEIEKNNLDRLKIWMTTGLDVKNGIWAILGARQGFYLTNFEDWDYTEIRNFDWLNLFYNENIKNIDESEAKKTINELGKSLSKKLFLPNILSSKNSKFFKSFNLNQKRQSKNITSYKNHRYDIIMITYNELNAEQNYQALIEKFPHAKRINGIKGIHNAYKAAAKISQTEMFWAVDADAIIDDNFKFDYYGDPDDYVRVWRAKNSVNDLIYGYGGVKLLPKNLTLSINEFKHDITTSISVKYMPIHEISNVTYFNTDPFSAWKSAFRECCKLSSKIIDRQQDKETVDRLSVWCSKGKTKNFGKFVIDGANEGKKYGELNKNNKKSLLKINNFKWLEQQFKKKYPNLQ